MKKVSVIITTYKGSNFLSRAIESVLNQTYSNFELIIVDDNSPDSTERNLTEQLMQQYEKYPNIVYIKHDENLNGAVARNTGIKAMNGEFVAFLDDDDYYEKDKLEKCVNALLNNNEYHGVYTSVAFDVNGKISRYQMATEKGNLSKNLLLNENLLGTGSNIFLSAEVFQKLHGFNEKYQRNQDVEFMLRFFRYYKIINIEDVLVVKSTNGINNIPPFEKLYRVKKLLLEDFKNEIDNLSEIEKERFYTNMLSSLLNSGYIYKNKKDINEAEKLYRNFGYRLSLKNKIRKLIFNIGLYDFLIANKIKK